MANKCNKCSNKNYIKSCTVNEQGLHHSFNDQPAIIWNNGDEEWFINGLLNRKDDLPSIVWKSGTQFWCKDGLIHRENKPSVVWNTGNQEWFYEGREMLYVKKLTEETFQYKNKTGRFLEHIANNIYLVQLEEHKYYAKMY